MTFPMPIHGAIGTPSITYINQAQSTTTSVTIPAHEIGDVIIGYAIRYENIAITLPAGWTSINAAGQTDMYLRVAYKIATTASETSGTWTGADDVAVAIYRPVNGRGSIGGVSAQGNNSGSTATYPAVTFTDTSGPSWVITCAHNGYGNFNAIPPAGLTDRIDISTRNSYLSDTNGGVTSFTSRTRSISSSGPWRTVCFELVCQV